MLLSTARVASPGSVRVVWLSSVMAENFAPNAGVDMDNLDYKMEKYVIQKYAVSKAANSLYSAEFARRYGNDDVTSVSLDLGNLKTDLQRVASPGLHNRS
ncbi:hypothetical protein F4818DRAFT_450996 [Hypoxylon cercidicola]|nr:hypothetical protein F4818DRAFT_450996 [Hypoxylon cercidicola]